MIIDFHTHGKLAKYLKFSPEYTDWLFGEAKAAGLDAVCLTEHFNTLGFSTVYADIASRFPREGDAFNVNGLLVFPGMEVDIAESGHTLVLGTMDEILDFNHALEPHKAKDAFLPLAELAAEVRARGLFFGAGHPFREPGHIPEQAPEALAAFEFVDLNGKDLAHDFEGTIAKTYVLAERLGVPVVSGSDTHQAFQYGCVTTHLDERVTTVAELRAQVLAGAYHIEYASDLAFKVKTAGMLKRSLKEIDRLGGDYVQTLIAGAE